MQKSTEDQKIYFRSEEHRDRFREAIQTMGSKAVWSGNRLDQEYSSMLLVLTCSLDIWERMQPYITRNGINIGEALEEVPFSTTERAMVALAGNLFGQLIQANPVDLVALDPRNFEVCVMAMRLRKNPYHLADIEA